MKAARPGKNRTCKKREKTGQENYMSPLLVKKRASPAFWARRQVGNCAREKNQVGAKRKKSGDLE